ncbi:hypothetical protein [Ottowia thiooxydans]|uniref:hypothetical protein n=1 Tax=Ottowia thiooxydans TaxID=219182 RepID=UPI000414F573|nr:hypothetical protein [Ottowia thiooxydans]
MRFFSKLSNAYVLAIVLFNGNAWAQFNVGAGSSIDFGDAVVDMGCSDLVISGTANTTASQLTGIDDVSISAGGAINGGSGLLSVSGDFANGGSFSGGSGSVMIVDGCGKAQSRISGESSFNNLSITTGTGKEAIFEAGKTTNVAGTLTLKGVPANLLKIRSSTPLTPALLAATSAQSIRYVDVADNRAVGAVIALGLPHNFDSIASGKVYRWFRFDEDGNLINVPVPTLSQWAILALSTLVMLLFLGRRPTRKTAAGGQ